MTRSGGRMLDEMKDAEGVKPSLADFLAEVAKIQDFVRSLPDRDTGSPEELLGYDEHGLWGATDSDSRDAGSA